MRRLATILTILAAGLVLAPSALATPPNVTDEPSVQRDLSLAVTYWHHERPELSPHCGRVEVEVATLEEGEGAPGTIYPAADAWAQTVIGECLIKIAPAMWTAMNEPAWMVETFTFPTPYTEEWAPTGPREACVDLIHEYGHVLGLPDTNSPGMMEFEPWDRGPSPCEAAYPLTRPHQQLRHRHRRSKPLHHDASVLLGAAGAEVPLGRLVPAARSRATVYWRSAPCEGRIRVMIEQETPTLEREESEAFGAGYAYAWSTWNSPDGANSKTGEPASYSECAVHLNKLAWEGAQQPWGSELYREESLCTVMAHEYGNLWGLPEVDTPGMVMSRTEPSTPPNCRGPLITKKRQQR